MCMIGYASNENDNIFSPAIVFFVDGFIKYPIGELEEETRSKSGGSFRGFFPSV